VYEYNALITRVHDGDTFYARIDLGFWTWHESLVRLAGIDAPELGTVKAPNPPGEEATRFLMELLAPAEVWSSNRTKGYFGKFGDYQVLGSTGIQIRIETRLGGDTEKYGRVLGTVRLRNGSNVAIETINGLMLESGYALPKEY